MERLVRPYAHLKPPSAPAWPLALPFTGLPIWWLLGLWQLMFFAVAVVMAIYLVQQRVVLAPRFFSLWLLWLTWLLTGLLVLQVAAPGTIPGVNMNRYLVFAYRYGWFVVTAIFALYVINTRADLSTKKILDGVSWFFVMLAAGGILGLVAPTINFDSLFQMVLPGGLASNDFVNELTHVQTAQTHVLLGAEHVRPSAPFIYTNSWGFAVAVTLPLFVVSWWRRGTLWRIAMTVVLVLALFPIVLSLNRGMWIAIGVCSVFALLYSACRGNFRTLLVGVIGGAVLIGVLSFSSVGTMMTERIMRGHSDEVRGNLSQVAVQSTLEGSPVVGFGTTRNLLGNFNSIAGGSSAACSNCEPPPVGTHGQIWFAIFGTGFVGAAIYVSFIFTQFFGNLRSRSPYALGALASVLTLIVTLPIYNGTGVGLCIGFVAIGILGRESNTCKEVFQSVRPILKNSHIFALCIGIGVVAGWGVDAARGNVVTATQRILVPAAEFSPVPGTRTSTLDSEAMLVWSQPVLNAVAEELGIAAEDARERLTVGAEANTRVLLVTFEGRTKDEVERGIGATVDAMLTEREAYLEEFAGELSQRYRTQYEDLRRSYQATRAYAAPGSGSHMGNVLAATVNRMEAASDVLATVEGRSDARIIAEPRIKVLRDSRTIRMASGAGLGILLGILVTYTYERRFRRLGSAPDFGVSTGVPIVAQTREQGVDAVNAARVYRPLAGVLAPSGNQETIELAARVERFALNAADSTARVLVVLESRMSRNRAVRSIHALRSKGLEPVGIILITSRTRGWRGGRSKNVCR